MSTLEYNSAEGAGGKFAGPYIRTILAETNLVELKLCEHWSNYIAKFLFFSFPLLSLYPTIIPEGYPIEVIHI